MGLKELVDEMLELYKKYENGEISEQEYSEKAEEVGRGLARTEEYQALVAKLQEVSHENLAALVALMFITEPEAGINAAEALAAGDMDTFNEFMERVLHSILAKV